MVKKMDFGLNGMKMVTKKVKNITGKVKQMGHGNFGIKIAE